MLGRLDPRIRPKEPEKDLLPIYSEDSTGEVWVGRWPVTNLEFERFVQEGYKQPEFWGHGGWEWLRQHSREPERWREHLAEHPNYPVVGVSFYEAAAYCRWLSKQYQDYAFYLPTALNWDRAALGADSRYHDFLSRWLFESRVELLRMALRHRLSREFSAEPSLPVDEVNALMEPIRTLLGDYSAQLKYHDPVPVGVFPPNRGGFFDLFGGVWEWCDSGPSLEPNERPSEENTPLTHPIVVKGRPAWGDYDPARMILDDGRGDNAPERLPGYDLARMILGGFFDPQTRFERLGFRLAAQRIVKS